MKYSIIVLLSIFSFASCSSKSDYENCETFTYDDFKTTKELKGQQLEFDSLIMHPSDVLVYDSLLVTIEYDMDKLIHIYNLKTKKKMAAHVNKGQGPDDMIRPQFMANKDHNCLQVFDMATSIIYEYNIIDFVNTLNPMPQRRIKLKERIPLYVAQEMGKNFVGQAYKPTYRLNVFDNSGEKINEIIDYPKAHSGSYSDVEKMAAYYMNFATNGIDKIAICHYMTDLIEIYNQAGVLQKRIHGPEQFLSYSKEFHEGDGKGAYPDKGARDAFFAPENGGNELLVLYNGGYIDEEGHSTFCNKLFSFTWDGIPQVMYTLDDPIYSFCVDVKNKKIYGISETPEYHIVKYDL